MKKILIGLLPLGILLIQNVSLACVVDLNNLTPIQRINPLSMSIVTAKAQAELDTKYVQFNNAYKVCLSTNNEQACSIQRQFGYDLAQLEASNQIVKALRKYLCR